MLILGNLEVAFWGQRKPEQAVLENLSNTNKQQLRRAWFQVLCGGASLRFNVM